VTENKSLINALSDVAVLYRHEPLVQSVCQLAAAALRAQECPEGWRIAAMQEDKPMGRCVYWDFGDKCWRVIARLGPFPTARDAIDAMRPITPPETRDDP
jgi:hypothetical protein